MSTTNPETRRWRNPLRRAVGRLRRGADRRRHERFMARLAGPRILRAFAEAYPTARFVEVGANDGVQQDHLRPFLTSSSWQGIMVEPVPYVFERLTANYASYPNIALANVAVADRDGELPFYHLARVDDEDVENLQWYDGLGSLLKEAVVGHASLMPGLEERVQCIQIPCLTFDSLCQRYGLEEVDLLLVDTEGYDREVLRGVDWDVHRPRLVVFEHYHLSPEDRSAVCDDLSKLGYEFTEEGFDTWCLRTDVQDALTKTFRRIRPGLRAQTVGEDR